MATTQLQLRRGNSNETAVFCGAEGELIYDTTNQHLIIHDGHMDEEGKFDHTGKIIPNKDEVVNKAIDETITGIKTFDHGDYCPIKIRGAIDLNNIPATGADSKYTTVLFQDKGGKRTGVVEQSISSDGFIHTYLACTAADGTTHSGTLGIEMNVDGTRSRAYCPTPAVTSNDISIATTAWCKTSGNGLVHTSGDETIGGTKTFSNKIYANNGIQGTASSALWADLAEQYSSDEKYPIGTLIKFGGEKDITIANDECNGIISERPGFLLDCELEDSLPVALVGKTRVRVIGKVHKFDKLVLSEIPGVAKVKSADSERVIGIALTDSDIQEEKLVMAVVKISF